MEQLLRRAKTCAHAITEHDDLLVISHIDADGLTSAGIICKALDRLNIGYTVKIVKKLDPETMKSASNAEAVIFTDLGSGALALMDELGSDCIIADHHQPMGTSKTAFHLNPHLFGIDGATHLSGAGTTYLVARALGDNVDLADLAIVGAVGDLQHLKERRLVGVNRLILEEGVRKGILKTETDLLMFGKQTRPLHKLLEYSSTPYIPGITSNSDNSVQLLMNLGIALKDGEQWRRWIDLDVDERRKIVSELMQRCISCRMHPEKVQSLVGEVYTLLREDEGTVLRDASEFSTLLNATARYGFETIGVAVCMGDRKNNYKKACDLLTMHRQNLLNGIDYVKEVGITPLRNLQYFHAGNNILETIVGIVAGMSMNLEGTNRKLPIVAFANSNEEIKVSARGTQELVDRKLNLARAINQAAESVGGVGGGHDIAAGATIPTGTEEKFLAQLDEIIGQQIQ